MATTTKHFITNDEVLLAYESAGRSGPVVVLIHGWSGSRRYFQCNIGPLSSQCRVYAVDLRHHGDSSSVPDRGYHIARLAADLRDFLQALDLTDVTGGCEDVAADSLRVDLHVHSPTNCTSLFCPWRCRRVSPLHPHTLYPTLPPPCTRTCSCWHLHGLCCHLELC